MHLYERKHGIRRRGIAVTVVLFLAALVVFVLLFAETDQRQSAKSSEQIALAIRQAAVTCYAIEGRYPESLAYLTEHYGVVIETDAYLIQYDVFAENIMPTIRVLKIGGEA